MKDDKNQGEGDTKSGMRYDANAAKFVTDGKVEEAADQARLFVDKQPREAAQAERDARRGPQPSTVDHLVEKGLTLFERLRHAVRSRRGH